MIRFRPARPSVTASLKDEHVFDTMEEMKDHIYSVWSRFYAYVGAAAPLRPDEILIGEARGDDALTGYRNVRQICISRADRCIGYCGE